MAKKTSTNLSLFLVLFMVRVHFVYDRLSELRREVTSRLPFLHDKETVMEGLLLSQDVAVNMLDDVRQSAKRCLLVSNMLIKVFCRDS